MIDDLTTDDFDKYVTPATSKRQREFRTDRNNNPIAAAVTTGGKNQFTDALDQAEIPWEHGDPFPGNPKLSTIKIKGDPYEGARAILSNSNALKWYRTTTGKSVLPKYGVRSSADFTKLPIDHQNAIIDGIYQSEGGSGKIKPTQDDFDRYVSQESRSAPMSDDDFDKYVTSQQPLSSVTAGMQGQQPREKVSVEAKPADFQGETPQEPTADLQLQPQAKSIPFQQAKVGDSTPPTLNPIENLYHVAENEPQPSGSIQQQFEQRRLKAPESAQQAQRVKLSFPSQLNPSPQDVEEAYVQTLGPDYEQYNKMHVAQTGRNLVSFHPDQLAGIKREADGSFYISPRKDALDYLNAYVTSGGNLDKANEVAWKNRQGQFDAAKLAQQGAKQDVAEIEVARKSEGAEGSLNIPLPYDPLDPAAQKSLDVSGRAITGPTERFIAGIGKMVGGLSSLGGLTPNQFSDYMNRKSEITTLGASLPPLTPEGKEIQKNVPEKVATALGDLGYTVFEIAILKKITGLSAAQVMGLETALKTSDKPASERAVEVAKNYALGSVLDAHVGRLTSAAIMGTPAAVEGAQQVARDQKDPYDVLLDTGIQSGIGAILGGGKSEELTDLGIERAPVAGVQGRGALDTEQVLADREAAVKPVTDAQGNVLLNPEEVVQGGKPKIKLVNQPSREGLNEEIRTKPDIAAQPQSAQPRTNAEAVADISRIQEGTVQSEGQLADVRSDIPRHVDLQPRRQRGDGKGQFKEETKAQREARLAQVNPEQPNTVVPVSRRNVEMMRVSDLSRFADRQATPNSPEESAQLKAQVQKEGVTEPLILSYDPNTKRSYLSEGNNRLAIAKELGIKELPVRVLRNDATPDKGIEVLGYGEKGHVPSELAPSQIGLEGRSTIPRTLAAPQPLLSESEIKQTAVNLELPEPEVQEAALLPVGEINKRFQSASQAYTDAVKSGMSVSEIAKQGLDTRAGLYTNLAERAGRVPLTPVEVTRASEPQPIETKPNEPLPADTSVRSQPQSVEAGIPRVGETAPELKGRETPEPEFVARARERLASREAHVAQGGEFRGSGSPDTQPILDSLIVKGWELYDQKVKPTFQEWSRKLREEFGLKAEEHLRGVWAKLSNEQPSEESTTAAKKAAVDEDRAARGAEPLPWKPETKADEDLLSEANRRSLANPREAQQLTTEVLKKPRALSDVETVQLDVHKQELVNDHNQTLKEIAETDDPEKLTSQSARLDAIEQEFDDTDRAWRLSGTEKGRSLRAQRITINQNYELLPMKARMKAATGEAKLSPEVEAKIETQQKRIAELEDRWNKRVAAREEKARTDSVYKVIIEKKIEIRRAGRQRSREALTAERADLKQQVAQAWAKMKPKTTTLSMGGLGDLDPNGELSRALGSLARNYIEDGVIKAADLIDAVHEQIKDVADLTKRQVSDLISGYGRTRESTADPVETKLNEVKSILASTSGKADVLEKGIRPLRRGQQREKPTEDQRHALRELEDAMREKGPELARQPYDVKTEQATPLDKAKTTARNRQEQLRKWIADGKREVQGRQQVIPDAELNRLKAENAALEKVVALLDDPAADQKAIERRMGELQKMIVKQRSSIQSGQTSSTVKEGAKSTWSPEIGAMEKERQALMRIANDMRSEAARKAKATVTAKPIGVYGVEGSWADFEARAKKALAARKRFEKQIADMQQRRAAGDFEKKPKVEPLVHDPDTERLRLEMNREKRKFDADVFNAKIKKEWSERPLWSRGMAYGAAAVRAGVLSGVKTLGKIGSALAQRTGQQYAEEGASRLAKPFVRGTAEKATRYGGHMNAESEKAFARGFGAGVKEIPNIIRTGESELSRRFSDRHPGIPTKIGRALEVPGRFHFSEKNPLMRGEFERYKELALQEAERKSPGARNDPVVIDAIEERAYKSAKEVILMGDNPFSRMITDAQRRLSLEQRDVVRTIVPVHRVAGNYLNQAINEYGLGIFRGAIRAIHERNPDALAKLTPEEADKTMRLIQRGTLGVVYMALAGTGIGSAVGVKFGGFYKRGRKDEVQPQDIKIGKVTIPHWALHSPPDELAQLTASMKQEWDEGKQREETAGQRFSSGAARSIKGVMSQTPFVSELTQVTNSLDSGDSLAGWAGRFVASRVESQIVQEIARTTDKYQGQDVKRKPRGFTDALKMGLPVSRETVPISTVFGSQASKASNEVQRLDMTLNGVVKKSDESRQEFAERQPLVDGYIRRALEKEVIKSDYQKDSDPSKIERLKQVKEAAEKEGQAAYDATPRPPKFKKEKQLYPVPSGAPQSSLKPWLPPRNPFKVGSEAFKA